MFIKRLLSGIILLIFSFLLIFKGGLYLILASIILSIMGLYELYKVMNIHKYKITIFAYLFSIIYYILLYFKRYEYIYYLFIITFLVLMIGYVAKFSAYNIDKITKVFFGIFYVSLLFSFIYLTRIMKNGFYIVWLIFISSWGCDTMAYCSGMLVGKHKIAPILSPKKSIEGSIGGLIGVGILTFIYLFIFKNKFNDFHLLIYPIICIIAGIFSQLGDFAASAIKRNYNTKDYGSLIPGHGGILDRFDSILFTAPIIYILCRILG